MLNQFSDQQLIDELAHRERKRKPRANKPVDNPDFSQVVDLCKEYLEEIKENRYADSDTKHYIFEVALEAVYGKSIWEYVRAIQK
jgi:hypothetical protein